MRIHTIKMGESVAELAREYEISEELLRAYNDLPEGEGAIGEELCILRPTRCYAMRKFDSPESLANRFSTSKRDLMSINPHLSGRGKNGKAIALKIPERTLGGAVSLGYIYNGCDEGDLRTALPHMSYAVICAGVCDERGARLVLPIEATKRVLREGEAPYLLRFHVRSECQDAQKLAEQMRRTASDEGAVGIVVPCEGRLGEIMATVMPRLRELTRENGLFLITELDEESPEKIYETSDASIFSYEALGRENPLSFSEGVRSAVLDFSAKRGSCLGFLELPSLALVGKNFVSKKEALDIARKNQIEITTNPDTLLSGFRFGGREYLFPSLENVKAHLNLAKEAGLAGVCFDVMRTPINTLMTYTSLYKTRGALPLKDGGCKRE